MARDKSSSTELTPESLSEPSQPSHGFRDFTVKTMVLDEAEHTYRLLSDPDARFTSCTEFVDWFFEPFDKNAVAAKLVASHPKYREHTVEALLEQWQQAADEGTRVHAEIETGLLENKTPPSNKARQAFEWIAQRLPSSRYDLYPEVVVYSEALRLAGTLDLLVYDRKTDIHLLIDWKTNKRITREAFGNKKGIRGPALQLGDCHLVRYGLQLSLYHYILEKEYGLHPRKQALVHLTDWEATAVPCAYARDTVEALLAFGAERLRAERF